MTGILAGLRIVEGSAFIAAPLGGMTLAQLGADVIRFDDIKGGLDSDRWPVTEGRPVDLLGRPQQGQALDRRRPAHARRGRELLTALITAPGEGAGIFTTNMPARGWLAYEELSKKRADLIALNIVGARDGSGACRLHGERHHRLPAWSPARSAMTGRSTPWRRRGTSRRPMPARWRSWRPSGIAG